MNIVLLRPYHIAPQPDDYLVLVDRLWPRNLSKITLKLAEWNEDLALNSELCNCFNHEAWINFTLTSIINRIAFLAKGLSGCFRKMSCRLGIHNQYNCSCSATITFATITLLSMLLAKLSPNDSSNKISRESGLNENT